MSRILSSMLMLSVGCANEPAPTRTDVAIDSAGLDSARLDSVAETDSRSPIDSAPTIDSALPLLADDFEAHMRASWTDGSTHRVWRALFSGYGVNAVVLDGSNVLSQSPRASTKLDETHACLVVSTTSIAVDFDLSLRMKTVRQLRTPTPNAWEAPATARAELRRTASNTLALSILSYVGCAPTLGAGGHLAA